MSDNKKLSYNEWIEAVQTDRNAEWEWNVMFDKAPDMDKPPPFPRNTLFHEKVEAYSMVHTTVASHNVRVAAEITRDEKLFAPCMVGTLESQFLKLIAKTKKVKSVLDVGTFTGMSAIAFAEGALANGDDVVVHTLEFDERTAQAAQKIFDRCEERVNRVIQLHHTDAIAWMQECADDRNGPTFDIIFIDADKENYVAYYELAMGNADGSGRRSLLAKDGIILADNSLSALVYDEDDERRVALHKFNQVVKNDDRVEQVVMTVREGITMISRCD